jgi:hypothetical protein
VERTGSTESSQTASGGGTLPAESVRAPHSSGGDVESPLHESSNIRLRTLINFVIGFVLAAVVIHVVVYWVFAGFRAAVAQPREITGVAADRIPPPEPRLEPSIQHNTLPSMDLEQLRAAEHDEFARRGWVDPQTGQVRVPEKIVNQLAELSRTAKK